MPYMGAPKVYVDVWAINSTSGSQVLAESFVQKLTGTRWFERILTKAEYDDILIDEDVVSFSLMFVIVSSALS
jgi:hypothetical protein